MLNELLGLLGLLGLLESIPLESLYICEFNTINLTPPTQKLKKSSPNSDRYKDIVCGVGRLPTSWFPQRHTW